MYRVQYSTIQDVVQQASTTMSQILILPCEDARNACAKQKSGLLWWMGGIRIREEVRTIRRVTNDLVL